MGPPSQQIFIPIFVLVSYWSGRVSASGTVIVAACIALVGLVVAVFSAVSRTHAMAMCGAESARNQFSFDFQHQLVDAEI